MSVSVYLASNQFDSFFKWRKTTETLSGHIERHPSSILTHFYAFGFVQSVLPRRAWNRKQLRSAASDSRYRNEALIMEIDQPIISVSLYTAPARNHESRKWLAVIPRNETWSLIIVGVKGKRERGRRWKKEERNIQNDPLATRFHPWSANNPLVNVSAAIVTKQWRRVRAQSRVINPN